MSEQEFKVLKEQHDEAQESLSEARGMMKSAQARLENEFGFKTWAEAKAKLTEWDKEVTRLEKEVNQAKTTYQKEFAV